MSDLISKTSVCEILADIYPTDGEKVVDVKKIDKAYEAVQNLSSAQQWIPVKWHEITDEERERESYPKDWVIYLDSPMPEDNQEILIQTKSGHICSDICYCDDGYSLDSGWDWVEDIAAWMPLPEP